MRLVSCIAVLSVLSGCGDEITAPGFDAAEDLVSSATPFALGVNIHHGRSAADNTTVATIMKQRGLSTARMDLIYDADPTALRDQVQRIRANGGDVEVTLQTSFQWDHSCNRDLAFIEQDAYAETAAAVHQVKDIVHDIELLNETQLRPEILAEVPWNTVGTATAPYEGKPCVATLTAALRGMSRAVRDIRQSSGLPLRTILGVVGRDFGFLTFMQAKGVLFDVVGYHIYPHAIHTSLLSDPWFGAGGPLAQLAVFNRPVRINEFNCGEIYTSSYENRAGSPTTETCLTSLDRHLSDLRVQTLIDLEAVQIYELLDEPQKAAPENRFGLMYDLALPKVHLFLISAFAGGALSDAERYEITRRGLLTDAEIDAMRGGVVDPPSSDSQPPSVQITSPADGAVFDRRSTVLVSASASDDVGVTEVRFFLGGATCVSTLAPYQCALRMPSKRGWRGTLEARAMDAAGNVGTQVIRVSTR
jgi:hypothetical protein